MINALPVLDRNSSNFRDDADLYLGTELPVFSIELNTGWNEMNANRVLAQQAGQQAQQAVVDCTTLVQSATEQAQSAALSALSVNAVLWVSGTTYTIGASRYSPLNSQVYRRLTDGAGTTDPSLDDVNWKIVHSLPNETIVLPVNNLPLARPSLLLDFANSQSLDPRIIFSRDSIATRTNSLGLIEVVAAGVPRIEFDAVTGVCKGLLIEEGRTNLLTYSEQFDNAAWLKGELTVTPNSVAAPDGTMIADTLVESTTAAVSHYIEQFKSIAASLDYTASYFLKANGRYLVDVSLSRSGAWTDAGGSRFDLLTGVVTSNTNGKARITPVGGGWFRCSVTGTKTSTTENAYSRLTLINEGNTATYTGDGTSGLFIWGAQLEAGAFPTSYIPTVASQVTRSSELVTIQGNNFTSWYRPDEGTFVTSHTVGGLLSTFPAVLSANNSSSAERFLIGHGSASLNFSVTNDSVTQANIIGVSGIASSGGTYKAASTYKLNDVAMSVNGLAVVTDTSATLPTVTQLNIGSSHVAGTGAVNGCIQRIAYYPERLSNANLQALST